MIDKTKTVKEICNEPDSDWSKEEYEKSPFPAWHDALMKKTYEEVNLFDVTRMITQKMYLEVALPKAIDFLNEDPYAGEFGDGHLLEMITHLKYKDVIQYKEDFDRILDNARNNLDSLECDLESERDDVRKIIEMFDYEKIKITDGKSKDINGQKRSDRYESLSPEIYEEWYKSMWNPKPLLSIKLNDNPPKIGDVFLVNPNPGLYFWGVIIDKYIRTKDGKDVFVVLIFKDKVTSLENLEFKIDLNNILFEPMLVPIVYWEKGYLYNIDYMDLSDTSIDFGFFKWRGEEYLDKDLNVVENPTSLIVTEAVYTDELFAKYIHEELIIDKSLAQCDETLKLI